MAAGSDRPVFYSFRRCPYAMRARMALASSQQSVELREIVLRDKPAEMLLASPKATVPVLVQSDGSVLEQSLDIMLWALNENDPHALLRPEIGDLATMLDQIATIDGAFKFHLDNYKYASRKAPDGENEAAFAAQNREQALTSLAPLSEQLRTQSHLYGNRLSLADVAIAPFVRQFANTDAAWFEAHAPQPLIHWLRVFVESPLFSTVMEKHAVWQSGTDGVIYPAPGGGSESA